MLFATPGKAKSKLALNIADTTLRSRSRIRAKVFPRNTCLISLTSLCRSQALRPAGLGWAWLYPVLSSRPMAARSAFSQCWVTVRLLLLRCRLLLIKESAMPERVLIIDDEENIRQMLRLTLETA